MTSKPARVFRVVGIVAGSAIAIVIHRSLIGLGIVALFPNLLIFLAHS
ncbi:hypothetical protein BH11ACT4_BH11ACT4_25670 [soil metagenome]